MIELIGASKKVVRIQTGFWSFDRAFENRKGEIGLPIRRLCEIFGSPLTGKSTLAIALAGIVAKAVGGQIDFVDLEGYDPELLETLLDNVGYAGTVKMVSEDSDAKMLEQLIKDMREEDCNVGIIDSLGAISPIGEEQGKLGEANMGQRAKLLAQLSRKANHAFNMKETPSILFGTNHALPMIGMALHGTNTPGGETKKFFAGTRIKLKVNKFYSDGSSLVQGTVEKNSFGFSKRKFYLFNLAGLGFHRGLTAVIDCCQVGLATEKSVIRMDGISYGRFSALVEKYQDAETFAPFVTKLHGVELGVTGIEDGEDEEDDE